MVYRLGLGGELLDNALQEVYQPRAHVVKHNTKGHPVIQMASRFIEHDSLIKWVNG